MILPLSSTSPCHLNYDLYAWRSLAFIEFEIAWSRLWILSLAFSGSMPWTVHSNLAVILTRTPLESQETCCASRILNILKFWRSAHLDNPVVNRCLFWNRNTPLPFFALSNLMTLFSHDMPTLPLVQHVFDYLLCRPPIAVIYLAVTVCMSSGTAVSFLIPV